MLVRHLRCGWTLLETLICLLVVVLIVAVVVINVPRPRRHDARLVKDSSQIRGIIQGMITFAQNSNERFPRPSVFDTSNATVAQIGAAKDTTANIMSLLVYSGFVPVEMLVSPAENNPNIRVMPVYQFSRPASAVDPANALWDPALSADFTSPIGGNVSYAHAIPVEPATRTWSSSGFTTVAPLVSSRGPQVRAVKPGADGTPRPVFADSGSNALRFYGRPSRWLIGYNDNHLDHTTTTILADTYPDTAGRARPDCVYYNEPDDRDGWNIFFGIFTGAGAARKDFTAIWD